MKDRKQIIKKIVKESIDERQKILSKKYYGRYINEEEKRKDKKPHHGVPPEPALTSPIENANYGGAARGATGEGGGLAGGDQDATDFILYAGITDPTQQLAIENLVSDLKVAGLWDKFNCLYPFVGNIADTMKWNLKDPRDEDDAFRITWNPCGTAPNISFTSNGVQLNGAGAEAEGGTGVMGDTHFVPLSDQTVEDSGFYMVYSRTSGISAANRMALASYDHPTGYFQLQVSTAGSNQMFGSTSPPGGPGYIGVNTLFPSSAGMFALSRTSSTDFRAYHNGIQNGLTATTAVLPGLYSPSSVYISSRHAGFACSGGFNNGAEFAFAAMGDGLVEAEVADLYAIIQDFQTTLGREV